MSTSSGLVFHAQLSHFLSNQLKSRVKNEMPEGRSARVRPLSASRRRTCDRVGLDARTSTGVMGIGDDGVDAGDGVARDEIVRETMVRDPKGDGK